ncbi:MAG: hypothetical protein OSA89_15660 [Mariniblastus sp.]|nr:hypothetical protein [Mariniblastus sp.]
MRFRKTHEDWIAMTGRMLIAPLCWKILFRTTGVLFSIASLCFCCEDLRGQEQKVIVVVGAGGSDDYQQQFQNWADNWKSAITSAGESAPDFVCIGSEANPSGKNDLQRLEQELTNLGDATAELWVVLIGHGTDDGKVSKFNLRGPDLSAVQLNQWLPDQEPRTIVVNCASSSGGFVGKLKHPNRVVITATKSSAQRNFARFGQYLSMAIDDPAFDLDKDLQTSLLEAVVAASSQTQEFYLQETRLATELAMIDDNGDGKGTPSDWFQGTRTVKKAKASEPDGFVANQIFLIRRGTEARLTVSQRSNRDRLERELELLRQKKDRLGEARYYQSIEPILLDLAKLYQTVDSKNSIDSENSIDSKKPTDVEK